MAKLSRNYPRTALPYGPTATTNVPTPTHESGIGFSKDPKTELFTLAVTNFVSEDTYYESAKTRDARFASLVRHCAQLDPEWTRRFIPWLRDAANMRTTSIVAAMEYVAAHGPNARAVINLACQRADEPAEALAYWMGTYGRKLPYALKRGLGDAVARLYNEASAVKYDSSLSPMRMGDVITLVTAVPRDDHQHRLFQYLIDVRQGREDPRTEGLVDIEQLLAWRRAPSLHNLPPLATWENTSTYIKPDAAFWQTLIPQMGYMALIRNLRNFENAGIDSISTASVANRLTDPNQVARSRQLPYRFWSAYKHSGTINFAPAIERALELSTVNVPQFPGKTLVMVDTSGSMGGKLSAKSKMSRVEAAALFGAVAIARSDPGSTICIYADGCAEAQRRPSVLRMTEDITKSIGIVGHGTQTWPSTRAAWEQRGPFDRVLVFTDMQDHPGRGSNASFIPRHVPVYVWDLAGYHATNIELGSGRYLLGGLSDQTFKLIPLLERGIDAGWPWEIEQ